MLCAVVFSVLVSSAPDASAAYAHVILAERAAAQGDAVAAVRELRLALVFDYESTYLHARLNQLVGEPKKPVKFVSKRLPSLNPRLRAETSAERSKRQVAER